MTQRRHGVGTLFLTPSDRSIRGSSTFVSFDQRRRWLDAVRCLVVAVPLIAWLALPGTRTLGWFPLFAAGAAHTAVAVLGVALQRAPRRVAVAAFTATLLLDGVWLSWAFRALDGFAGPVAYVILLHTVATTLLGSFRTGLKLSLWHCVLILVVIEADHAGLFGAQLLPTGYGTLATAMTVLLALTLTVSLFAAANERELRRRRYDAEQLRELALVMETSSTVEEVTGALAEFGVAELLAHRAATVVFRGDDLATPDAGSATDAPLLLTTVAVRGGEPATAGGSEEADLGPVTIVAPGSVAHRAVRGRQSVLVKRLDGRTDPLLTRLLPGADHLAVVPFGRLGGTCGVLVLDFSRTGTGRSRPVAARPAAVETRMLGTAEAAAVHAGQAAERLALLARLRTAADTDGLTGLLNRRALDTLLAEELERCRTTGGTFSVLIVDLDHFKSLNDVHGHQAGDDALRAVGRLLRTQLRGGATAARYGGEEFCVVVRDATVDVVADVAELVRCAVAELTGLARPITASIGFASFPDDGDDVTGVVAAADGALYRAKTGGRNRVCSAWDGETAEDVQDLSVHSQ